MAHSTPTCKKCGNKHYSFNACPSVFGTAGTSAPPGFRVIGSVDNNVSLYPIPPGYRTWHQAGGPVPKNDPPQAA